MATVEPSFFLIIGIVLASWTAISALLVTLSYRRPISAISLWKKHDGTMPALSRWLLLPYRIINDAINQFKLLLDKDFRAHRVIDGLYVGARPKGLTSNILRQEGIDCVLDVTAEYPVSRQVGINGCEYYCLPIFDHWTTSENRIHEACRWIHERRSAGKKILVHCALGRGRSVMVVTAYLLALYKVEKLDRIFNRIVKIRRRARLNKKQRKFVESLELSHIFDVKPRALLIANPNAGQEHWSEIKAQIYGKLIGNYHVDFRETNETHTVDQLVAEEEQWGKVDLLVACGGDGTVGAIAEVAMTREIPLGVLPIGTSNSFATEAYGVMAKFNPIDEACEHLISGQPEKVDCNTVHLDGKTTTSVLMVSLGLNARMITASQGRDKEKLGEWAYMKNFFKALFEIKPRAYTLELDDDEPFSIETRSIIAANVAPPQTLLARFAGAPDFSDGLFDLLYVCESRLSKSSKSPGEEPQEGVASHEQYESTLLPSFEHRQLKRLKISCPDGEEIEIAVDGEVQSAKELVIEVNPRKLTIIR